MQKRTFFAAIAAAAITAIASPSASQAQDPQPQPQTSKGEVALAPTFKSLLTAIDSTAAQTAKLTAMTEVTATNVQLVNVEDLIKDGSADSLTSALTKNATDVTALRTALGTNTAITGVLTANTVPLTAADVVAADVGADGKVVLYYWKKSQ